MWPDQFSGSKPRPAPGGVGWGWGMGWKCFLSFHSLPPPPALSAHQVSVYTGWRPYLWEVSILTPYRVSVLRFPTCTSKPGSKS